VLLIFFTLQLKPFLIGFEYMQQILLKIDLRVNPSAETYFDDRIFHIPIPLLLNEKPLEKLPFPLENIFQRIKKQTLAKSPWARQKIY